MRDFIKSVVIFVVMMFCLSGTASASWFALSVDEQYNWAIIANQDNKNKAIADALALCKKHYGDTCRSLGASDANGYIALAVSPSSISAYPANSASQAQTMALQSCQKNSNQGDQCEIAYETTNGHIPTQNAQNCRPTGQYIRCSSRCTNGFCTVTYENGCQLQVQVQPRFDMFTNQWTYPAPSC